MQVPHSLEGLASRWKIIRESMGVVGWVVLVDSITDCHMRSRIFAFCDMCGFNFHDHGVSQVPMDSLSSPELSCVLMSTSGWVDICSLDVSPETVSVLQGH